jgi:UDPglucose 6-dehydrogenase
LGVGVSEYTKKFNISVIGNGFLGSSIAWGFSNYANIKIYDKYKNFDTFEDTIKHGDILFFCLPTPFYADDNGRQDISILEGSVKEVHDFVAEGSNKIAVIKSTVLPGTNRDFQKKYPKLRFVSNPEFLSAASAKTDFVCAARNILGGEFEDIDCVDALYKHRFGNSMLTFKTTFEGSELAKYMSNLFFCTKLSFFNYVHSVCEKMDLEFDGVRDMIVSDFRIGRSHDKVSNDPNNHGFSGACLPKDLQAFLNFSRDNLGLEPKLLQTVWDQNLQDRPNRDWEQIGPSVVSYKNKK